MKKLLIVTILSIIIGGCGSPNNNSVTPTIKESNDEQQEPVFAKMTEEDSIVQMSVFIGVMKESLKDHNFENSEAIRQELESLGEYSNWVKFTKNSPNAKVLKSNKALKEEIQKYQIASFPLMRKAYTKIAADKVWENDISVKCSGFGATKLTFTGGIFAANKNIKATQEAISDMVIKLRFKKVQYEWYKEQDDAQYYELETPADKDLE
jgi:cytochrome c556